MTSFEDYAQMIAADKQPALTLAFAVVRNQATLDNLIDSNLSDEDLQALGWLCTAAWKCRRRIAGGHEVTETNRLTNSTHASPR